MLGTGNKPVLGPSCMSGIIQFGPKTGLIAPVMVTNNDYIFAILSAFGYIFFLNNFFHSIDAYMQLE